ncbi:winged helix-turn-helix domain-containing protein [Lactobacillus corticis]|uniref:Two-component system response regulator n=1 Tax=Lactobacillus corticis TaxID=2201249 RepID=A0A916VIF0_9LACO|nr:winged helix-turn-helix domain-containing protein [Lactobacillus corticis]GFZ27722.1 two-component system response regulator [Lactobacillus corticis]
MKIRNEIILLTENIRLFTGLNILANKEKLNIYNALELRKVVKHAQDEELLGIVIDLEKLAADQVLAAVDQVRRNFKGPIICLSKVFSQHVVKKLFRHQVNSFLVTSQADLILAQLNALLYLEKDAPLISTAPKPKLLKVKLAADAELQLDQHRMRAYINDQNLELTPKEYKLLEFLLNNPNQVLSRDQLLAGVWHNNQEMGSTRIVDMQISHLRDKIEPHPDKPQLLKTVRGFGYMLELPEQA